VKKSARAPTPLRSRFGSAVRNASVSDRLLHILRRPVNIGRTHVSRKYSSGNGQPCSPALQTLLTCIDGLCGTETLQIGRSGDRLFASGMDNTRRDALKSVSRVTTKDIAKSADALSHIASAEPDDASAQNGQAPVLRAGQRYSSPSPVHGKQQHFSYSISSHSTSEDSVWRCRRHKYKADL
jgi:hypothetical protein